MSDPKSQPIVSVGEFLAHALELEIESRERYSVLADSMEIHHNAEVAELFRKMAHYSDLHANEVQQRAIGKVLPTIAPWAFKWNCPDHPEAPCHEDANYLMTTAEALNFALHNELRGRDFYMNVAASTPDPEVRELAREMAEEERQHVALLKKWFAHASRTTEPAPEDMDPPNIPE